MRSARDVIVAATLLSSLVAGGARGAPVGVAAGGPMSDQTRTPLGFTVGLGMRTDLLRSPGLDAFSDVDAILQSVLSASYRLNGDDHRGLSGGIEWNHGTATSHARSAATSLVVDRLSLTLEGRFPLWRRMSAFGRIAPGLLHRSAQVTDASVPPGAYAMYVPPVLGEDRWLPAADVGAGFAFELAEMRGGGSPSLGFWLVAEGGYGYSPGRDLVLGSRAETQPGRVDEPVRLGDLSFRGAFVRAHLAVSF